MINGNKNEGKKSPLNNENKNNIHFFFPFPEFLSIQTAGNFTNEPKTDHNKSLKKKEKESSPDRESGAVRPEKGEQWAEERKREQEAYRKCPFRLCCRQGERPHLR